MEKLITVVINKIPTLNIAIKKEETIATLKHLLSTSVKDYSSFTVHMFINPKTELKVMNTNKYDKMDLKSVWKQMEKSVWKQMEKSFISLESQNKTLTGIKDVDLLILSQIDDKTLYNFCKVDKYAQKLCLDENFWKNRFIQRYGLDAIKYKPKGKSWKDHYAFVHYIVFDTGYTSRIIFKLGTPQIATIREPNRDSPGLSKISYPNGMKKDENADKIIFVSDSLWGNGVYSIASLEETSRVLSAIQEKGLNYSGIVVFRVDNQDDEAISEELFSTLDYCCIFNNDYNSDESDENDGENDKNEPKVYHTDDVTFAFKNIDAESG
jgi:hypothetical protein